MKTKIKLLNEEQRILTDALDGLFSRVAPMQGRLSTATVEAIPECHDFYDHELTSLLVPREHSGMGLGALDAVLVSYLAGFHGVPIPVRELVWAHGLYGHLDSKLRQSALSQRRLAIASPLHPLSDGAASLVSDLHAVATWREAEQLFIFSKDETDGHVHLSVVPLDAPGVSVQAGVSFDLRLHSLNVRMSRDVARAFSTPLDSALFDRFSRLWVVLSLAEIAGAAERARQIALDHIRQRVQFGSVIGSRQALQHIAADDLVHCENLSLAVEVAALACDEATEQEADEAVAVTMIAARQARKVLENAIQLHGAMGFTREVPLHHLLRRVIRLNEDLRALDPVSTLDRALERLETETVA